MKKKLMIISLSMAAFVFISCNNSNRVEAGKEAPINKADSVEQDRTGVENNLQ